MRLLLIALLFCSCNRVFFPRKETILHQERGFIVYMNDERYFFPDRESADFFSKKIRKDGSRIYQGCGMEFLINSGRKYVVQTAHSDQLGEFSITDTITVVPVNIRYIKLKYKIAKYAHVEMMVNNDLHSLQIKNIFEGEVLSIDMVRE